MTADQQRPVIRHTEPTAADPLAALRAEVEALRDHAALVADRSLVHGGHWPDKWAAREHALTEVLDLIDKHAREGQ